jgi:choline monooxygenase
MRAGDTVPRFAHSSEAHFITRDSMAGQRPVPKLPEIPRARYLDEAFHRSEVERVFKRSWLAVGHVSEYEKAGSYRLIDLPFAPVIVVRGTDGELRAFLNSCRHRGAAVLQEQEGCRRALRCQYHGWMYDLTGQLVSVTNPESFPDIKKEDYSLVRLRCELWGGFIFINLDKDARPLLAELEPLVRRYSQLFEQDHEKPLRVVVKRSWEIACNWKAMTENFCETYHVSHIHRSSAILIDPAKTVSEVYPSGHGTFYGFYKDMGRSQAAATSAESVLAVMPGMESSEYARWARTIVMFPGVIISCSQHALLFFQIMPLSSDRCRLDYSVYGVDWGDATRSAEWDTLIDGMDTIIGEDKSMMASIQRALEADRGAGIPLGSQEAVLYNLHVEIDRRIGPDNVPLSLRVPDALREFVAG